MMVHQPAEYDLWDRSGCHDNHEYNCTKVFDSESDEDLTKCWEYTNQYKVSDKVRVTLILVFQEFDECSPEDKDEDDSKLSSKSAPQY